MEKEFEKAKIVPPTEEQADAIKKNLGMDSGGAEKETGEEKTLDTSKKSPEEIKNDLLQEKLKEVKEITEQKLAEVAEKRKKSVEELKKLREGKSLGEKRKEDPEKLLKPETKKRPEKGKVVEEISEMALAGFEKDLNIKKEDLEDLEGFKELSFGQQMLVLENLKQLKLGRIYEDASTKFKGQIAEAKFLKRIWKNISKKYQIFELEKETAEEIKKGGINVHKGALRQLVNGMKEFGPEVRMSFGKLEIQYASEKDFNPEHREQIDKFNKVATEFSRIPDEWSKGTASKKDQKEYKKVKERYEQAKKNILNLKAEKDGEKQAALYLNKVENNIILNQLLNTHPEFEKQLKKIKDKKIWKRALKSVAMERGIYAGAGYLTRTATISLIGAFGAPLAAAGMGSFISWRRAKGTLKEREIMARKGVKDVGKEAKNFVDVGDTVNPKTGKVVKLGLAGKLGKLISKVESDPNDKNIASLNARIKYTKEKIEQGLVNFGTQEKRLFNQYELIKILSNAMVFADVQSKKQELKKEGLASALDNIALLPDNKDIDRDLEKRLDKFLEFKREKISKARRKYLRDQAIRGAVMGAGAATAGYAIRHFAQEFGWRGGAGSPKAEKVVEDVGEVKKAVKVPEVAKIDKASDVWEPKIAQKGDSTLLLAKRFYAEHAKELGYKEGLGDINKWAGRFSTRHLVGQYISEHQDDYKELINRVGMPPKNPAELNKWVSKVPKSAFNDILNNKAPNLIHQGDIVKVGPDGDINVHSPEGKLRTDHLPLPKEAPQSVIPPKEIFAPEQIEEVEEIASAELKKPEIMQGPPIPDETGSSPKGETPIGSADRIEQIRRLFGKEGINDRTINKLIEQVKAGKINREDFRELLIDEARKDDGFVSVEEKAKINAIMNRIK